jgi:hypothetical protein
VPQISLAVVTLGTVGVLAVGGVPPLTIKDA